MDRQTAIDQLLDHYDNPRHYGVLDGATFQHEGRTPGCGDRVRVYVTLDGQERIAGISFEGKGCTISQGAASITMTLLAGKTLAEALSIDHEALIDQLGREIITQRITCATLALDVFKQAARDYKEGHAND